MAHWKNSFLLLTCIAIVPAGCSKNNNPTFQGYIEGNYTYIASQVTGELTKLPVNRGSNVAQNQLLFSLEPTPQSDAVAEASAQVESAKANLANLEKGKRPSELAAIKAQQRQVEAQLNLAMLTVSRYRELYKRRYIEKASLDQATSNYNDLRAKLSEISQDLATAKLAARSDEIAAAKANVEKSLAALKQAKWQLEQKAIISPIAGFVFDRYYRIGEVVPAGHPVLSILEPQNIYLVSYLPEKFLSQIKLGEDVQFSCDGCTKQMSATVSFISPQAEYTPPVIYSEKTRDKLIYRIEADLTPAEQKVMHPGQPVTVIID